MHLERGWAAVIGLAGGKSRGARIARVFSE
jgi:hypothetical protein